VQENKTLFAALIRYDDSSKPTAQRRQLRITVTYTEATFNLHNNDMTTQRENIHILLPGESFEYANRLMPGSSRQVELKGFDDAEPIEIRAGRNGQVLATTQCIAPSNDFTATVSWDGSNLTCQAEANEPD